MHLSETALTRPAVPAACAEDGSILTFAELDDASRRLACYFEERGLGPGDTIAILLPNGPTFSIAAWGAQRTGLLFVPVNWHLSTAEAAHIVADSGARALVTSDVFGPLAEEIAEKCPLATIRLMDGTATSSFESLSTALCGSTPERRETEPNGHYMFYSSGTTGRPKGIRPSLAESVFGTPLTIEGLLLGLYGFDQDTTYLSTGPLYHAAPLAWSLATQALGGQVVMMDRFDPEKCLALIEEHRVTHAQFVPTMFVRMLKLPEDVRQKYDLSSLEAVVHAAAPCPPEVKRAMIDWFGPIVHEYYAGSEGVCFFAVDSGQWLAHPGTVGRALISVPHILDDHGAELPTGEVGQIWYDSPLTFKYHNDPEKTSGVFNDRGWSTLGDLGHLDDEGYLYLSDRRTDLILRGGVNIYPREIEDALVMHPDVADVAVVGVPHDDMGEEVVAVVQLAEHATSSPDLERHLAVHLEKDLARFKLPRRWVFVAELPRLPSGKILRRVVRDDLAWK
jgi:acyl-CoA synthetase (AMP-forming)/AMP-acid ligase II